MQDVAAGKRMPTDTISKYIPEFAERVVVENFNAAGGSYTTRPPREPVRIRHLLSHSSGLAYGFTSDVVYQIAEKENAANPTALLFDPGTRWNYAYGISVTATVLERI